MTLPLNIAAKYLARHSQEPSPITPELPKQATADVSPQAHPSTTRASEDNQSSPSATKTWLHSPKLTHRPSPILWGAMSASLLLHLALLAVPLPEKKVVSSSVSTKKTVTLTSLPQQQELEVLDMEQNLPPVVTQATPIPPPKFFPAPQPLPSQKSPFEKRFDALTKQPIQKITIPESKKEKEPQPKPVPKQKNTGTVLQNPPPPPKPSDWDDFPLYPQAQPGCFDLRSCMRTEDDLYSVSGFFEQDLAAKKYTLYPVTTEAEKKIYRISRGDRTEFLSIFTAGELGTAYVLSKDLLNVEELLDSIEVGLKVGLNNPFDAEFNCQQFAQPKLFCVNNVKRAEIDSIEFSEGMDVNTLFWIIRPGFEADGYNISEVDAYGGGVVYALEKDGSTTYINVLPDKDNTGAILVTWNSLPQPLNP